jgi:hypothetical protein
MVAVLVRLRDDAPTGYRLEYALRCVDSSEMDPKVEVDLRRELAVVKRSPEIKVAVP